MPSCISMGSPRLTASSLQEELHAAIQTDPQDLEEAVCFMRALLGNVKDLAEPCMGPPSGETNKEAAAGPQGEMLIWTGHSSASPLQQRGIIVRLVPQNL